MIEDPKLILAKIDADLDRLLEKPRMHGDDESVEMQFLALMGVREFIAGNDPNVGAGRSDRVMKPYFAVLQKHFGTWFQPACCLLNRGLRITSEEKTKRLCEILAEVRKAVLETK